ncbi:MULTISPECIES: energy transducer TonB [unclassified Iodidimonas]|jgi:protein TonB|uniref:energy transducer TonB n=1 Tax=unclassified Iodidimonas TaxID=2626145 RepID=UPI002482303D|nr:MULTISPECIES: energy transducer TonB [unclassified Iodidimonas]
MLARYVTALMIGTAVTFALFYIMQALVVSDRVELSDIESVRFVDVVRVDRQQEAKQEDRKVEKPVPPEAPPPDLDIPNVSANNASQGLNFGQLNLNAGIDSGGVALGAPTDGDYLPLVRIQPQYPRRAAERGIEGYVIVELTVTPQGTVEDVLIVEAEPRGYFERSAEQAAYKFKYKPKVVNGEPIAVEGVQYLFSFNLEDGGRR